MYSPEEHNKIKELRRLTNIGGVFDLLTIGRMDESGDFTEGAGLTVDAALYLLGSMVMFTKDRNWFKEVEATWKILNNGDKQCQKV